MIVLAVGVVRGWCSTVFGVGAACARPRGDRRCPGPWLSSTSPSRRCASSLAALLLAFGLQWLRKAILRSSGYKPLHDEAEGVLARAAGSRWLRSRRPAQAKWTGTRSWSRSKECCSKASRLPSIVVTFWRDGGSPRARSHSCGGEAAVGRTRRRSGGARPAGARAREQAQVRRRRPADELWDLLRRSRAPASNGWAVMSRSSV